MGRLILCHPVFQAFKVRNLSEYFQTFLNSFKSIGHSQKASKTSPTCKNFNFGILDEAFQTQSFRLPKIS